MAYVGFFMLNKDVSASSAQFAMQGHLQQLFKGIESGQIFPKYQAHNHHAPHHGCYTLSMYQYVDESCLYCVCCEYLYSVLARAVRLLNPAQCGLSVKALSAPPASLPHTHASAAPCMHHASTMQHRAHPLRTHAWDPSRRHAVMRGQRRARCACYSTPPVRVHAHPSCARYLPSATAHAHRVARMRDPHGWAARGPCLADTCARWCARSPRVAMASSPFAPLPR